ncbi:MAG: hypothetical protein JO240_03205 [Solirubrobacterales bacterium]|nr:hypothetical protein [Solirubrobacterales bacterium]
MAIPTYQTVKLTPGRHPGPHLGACVMELASMLAEEPFTDRPATISPVIGAFLRTYNDGLDDGRRQDLYPLASLIVGTASGRAVERERASRCLGFSRSLGAALPGGRAAVGMSTPEASGTWAALAALRTGPSEDAHRRALAFVRELAALKPAHRQPRWPLWVMGRDPGEAVEVAMADVDRCASLEEPHALA